MTFMLTASSDLLVGITYHSFLNVSRTRQSTTEQPCESNVINSTMLLSLMEDFI